MFFRKLVQNIKAGDLVLEVGPGGTPHPRSDIFLEKRFGKEEAVGQRGYARALQTKKKIVYYEGNSFPFKDREFDYVICSHVLEHVEDVEKFLSELTRVARKGYIEFPTIYYDFIYNFPEHVTLLFYNSGTIYYMSKMESRMQEFGRVQKFFYQSLVAGHTAMIDELKQYFFQGFEWVGEIKIKKAINLNDVTFDVEQLKIPTKMSLVNILSQAKKRLNA